MPHDNCRDLRRKAAGIVPAGGVLALELDAAGPADGLPVLPVVAGLHPGGGRAGLRRTAAARARAGFHPAEVRTVRRCFESSAGMTVERQLRARTFTG